jgi:acyl-CoA synthetase (AMP-forming)/AMP-acid ligase II
VVTLWELVESSASVSPEAAAILAKGRRPLTYRELLDHLRSTTTGLTQLGLRRNDRVAIVLPNGPEMATFFLSVASVATSAPLNPAYSFEEFRFYMEDLGAKALVTSPQAPVAAAQAAQALGLPVLRLTSEPNSAAGVFSLSNARGVNEAELAQPDDIALVLHTSGTTSKPKLVPLTQRNLVASAVNIARSLELTNEDRCLNVMPLFHVHGLMAALLASLSAGGSVICSPGFNATEFFDWLRLMEPTWYTAVPTMHQAVLAKLHPDSTKAHRLRFIRSCSSALPPTLMGQLEQVFGVPVIEAYGMTEASHQMASNPLPPLQRKPGSVGVAAGSEVAIMDEAGNLVGTGTTGEVVVRGENVTQGYEANSEANLKSFINGWFRTGDQGYLDADGYLFLTGRIKELINRGGEKISPREIDEVLLQHPAVEQAAAFARPHPTLGDDVAAAVVLRTGATVSEQDLRAFMMERLAPFKVPSTILVLDQLPKGPTGKVQRIGMAERLAPQLAVEQVPPRDDFEALVADIWQEILAVPGVGVRDNFFALGGDSLRGTRVMARINDLFEVQLPVTAVFRQPTVELLTQAIRRVANPDRLETIVITMHEVRQLSPNELQRVLSETTLAK